MKIFKIAFVLVAVNEALCSLFFQDFAGQQHAENLSRFIVILFGAVGFVWGFILQQYSQTVYILGAGLALATLVRGLDPFQSIDNRFANI